jgi:hypothetical protein
MSSDKLDLFHIRLNGKIFSAWEFQFQLFIKGKELRGILMGVIPHLQMPMLCLEGKSWILGL